MKRFIALKHTADLRLRVFGKSKKDLFCNALAGMFFAAQAEGVKNAQKKRRKFKIKSADINTLLIDFLNEALTLADIHDEVYDDVKIEKFSDKMIQGTLIGRPLEKVNLEIKAATYHEINIENRDNIWQTTIIFDI